MADQPALDLVECVFTSWQPVFRPVDGLLLVWGDTVFCTAEQADAPGSPYTRAADYDATTDAALAGYMAGQTYLEAAGLTRPEPKE